MIVFNNGAFNIVDVKSSIALGSIVDPKVVVLEQSVAGHYGIAVGDLNDWKHDTDAKKMICFLLCHYLGYSVGSVASQYKINRLFLRNYIKETYKNCLLNANYMALVSSFYDNSTNSGLKAS